MMITECEANEPTRIVVCVVDSEDTPAVARLMTVHS